MALTCLTSTLTRLPEPLHGKYALEDMLGVGSFALVYKVRDRKTGARYAVKVVDQAPLAARGMLPQLQREVVQLQAHSGQPHIVKLHEVTELSGTLFFRFELCERTMIEYCDEQGPLDDEEAFKWLHEATVGVKVLHDHGVVHRDLKPANMLIDVDGSLRICDFGWCCSESDALSGLCGTPQYAPPEMLAMTGQVHTKKVDIYSLGTCLQHFLLGRIPEGHEDLPSNVSEQASDLLVDLMQADPDARPTVEELIYDRPELQSAEDGPLAQLWSSGRTWLAQHLGQGTHSSFASILPRGGVVDCSLCAAPNKSYAFCI